MTKYLLIAVAVLLAALGGTAWLLKGSYSTNGKQKAQIDQLVQIAQKAEEDRKATNAILAKRAKANAAAARANALLQRKLDAALAVQPEWANAPIPKEVIDALAE